jgi:hypothetical protein
MRWLSYRIFTAFGWRIEGELAALPKMVIVGAPHTSNWDFFLFLAALHHFRIKVRFLAKTLCFAGLSASCFAGSAAYLSIAANRQAWSDRSKPSSTPRNR